MDLSDPRLEAFVQGECHLWVLVECICCGGAASDVVAQLLKIGVGVDLRSGKVVC